MVLLTMRFQGNPPHTPIRTYEALLFTPPTPPPTTTHTCTSDYASGWHAGGAGRGNRWSGCTSSACCSCCTTSASKARCVTCQVFEFA